MEAPDFWTDATTSTAKMKELKSMKDDVAVIDKLDDLYKEIEKLADCVGYYIISKMPEYQAAEWK